MESEAIRVAFSGGEVVVKMATQGIQSVPKFIAFIKALLEKEKLAGQSRMFDLLKNSNSQEVLSMSRADYEQFIGMAKQYGIKYAPIGHIKNQDVIDIMIRRDDIGKCNAVFEKIGSKYKIYEDFTDQFRESVKEKVENMKGRNERYEGEPEMSREAAPEMKNFSISKMDADEVRKTVGEINLDHVAAFSPDNWRVYLEMQSMLYDYSKGNKERIYTQQPDVTIVMSKTAWSEIGREPVEDAAGIDILMPEFVDGEKTGRFVDATIYDISETRGADVDYSAYFTRITDDELDRMVGDLQKKYKVEYDSDLETDAFFDPESGKIRMQEGLAKDKQFQALQREAIYAKCAKEQGKVYTREANQFRAESVTYALSTKYGIDASHMDFAYVEKLAQEKPQVLTKGRKDILKDISEQGKDIKKVASKTRVRFAEGRER